MKVATPAIAASMFFLKISTNFFLGPFHTSNGDDRINSGGARDTTRLESLVSFLFFLSIYYTNAYFRLIYL